MNLNILLPMTGPNRFDGEEYVYPKPLIEIEGATMLERSLDIYNKYPFKKKIIPIVSLEDVRAFNIDYVVKQLIKREELELYKLDSETQGALCTSLLAVDSVSNKDPLIIANYDQIMNYSLAKILEWFGSKGADFGVVSFEAVHPKWSYVRLNAEGVIEEAAEKRPLSKNAIAGMYYFRKGSDFVEAAKNAILKRSTHANKYFISASLNEMILMGKDGYAHKIPNEAYSNFYDINEVKSFSMSLKSEKNRRKNEIERMSREYVDLFDKKDLDAIMRFFHPEFVLTDPVVKRISGASKVRRVLEELFGTEGTFSFRAENIAVSGEQSFIHFNLSLGNTMIKGVDVITWSGEKMVSLNAYMEEECG